MSLAFSADSVRHIPTQLQDPEREREREREREGERERGRERGGMEDARRQGERKGHTYSKVRRFQTTQQDSSSQMPDPAKTRQCNHVYIIMGVLMKWLSHRLP